MGSKLTAEEILAAGRLLARRAAPYFRAKLLSFVTRAAPGLGTVAASRRGIFLYDPEFVATLTPDQMGGLWIHETMHSTLRYFERMGKRDPALWNIAQDIAINPMVLEMKGPDGRGLQLPPHGCMPESFGVARGLTSDEYYELLLKQAQKAQQEAGEGEGDEEGDADAQGSGEGEGSPQDGDSEQGGGKSADHSNPGGGAPKHPKAPKTPQAGGGWCGGCAGNRSAPFEADDTNDPDGRSDAELDRIERQIAEAVRECAEKRQGKIPAELLRFAEHAMEPAKVPWQQRIARATRRAVVWRSGAIEHRFDAPGRRQAGLGYGPGKPVMPRLRMPVPRVSVVVDTSGSMGGDELTACLREVNGVLKATGAEIDFCACDARVHELAPIRRIEDAFKLLKGGGGTDFRPAFKALMDRQRPPELIVFATDGYGTAPDAPPPGAHVIWLLVGQRPNIPATWGECVAIDDAVEVERS